MTSIHQAIAARHARTWRAAFLVAALGAATLLPGAPARAQAPGAEDVLLGGPTGMRAGVAVPDATAPPDPATLVPLDTWGRDPALTIHAADPDVAWAAWQVAAASLDGGATDPVTLASGIAEVPLETITLSAPPPGDWLVTATLTSGTDATDSDWVWRLVVPDRSLPETIPSPDLVLFGGGRTVIAERGSSCFLTTCADIGQVPPARALPRLRLSAPDQPIVLTVSDGGGIARITAVVLLLDVDETRPVALLDTELDPVVGSVLIPPPPAGGRWRLEVTVGYADSRGDQVGYAVVAVPRS